MAVIVILAIIALIAVPIVVNIINDSKTSSDEQSVEIYLDAVEKIITKKQLSNPNFNPDKCEIQDNGDLKCYKNNELIDTLQIEMNGKNPEDGIIKIENNKFKFKNILYNNKIYYESYAKLIQDNNSNGKPDIGDKYSYRVNKTNTFNFYVLSFNQDNTVNLIMDRNICNDGTVIYDYQKNLACNYAWYKFSDDNTYGPRTIMTELYSGTKKCSNVPDMTMNYKDEANHEYEDKGYTSIITNNGVTIITGKPITKVTTVGTMELPLKARLPRYDEISAAGCTETAGSCPVWLMENMRYWNVSNDKYSMNNNSEGYQDILGYWLLSSYQDLSIYARLVYLTGRFINFGAVTSTPNVYGIRPVITVPIFDLE